MRMGREKSVCVCEGGKAGAGDLNSILPFSHPFCSLSQSGTDRYGSRL